MLIPSIDLQDGRIVQLVQGERLALEAADPEPWIARFSGFPRVQLIDLDAAKGNGDNAALAASSSPARSPTPSAPTASSPRWTVAVARWRSTAGEPCCRSLQWLRCVRSS